MPSAAKRRRVDDVVETSVLGASSSGRSLSGTSLGVAATSVSSEPVCTAEKIQIRPTEGADSSIEGGAELTLIQSVNEPRESVNESSQGHGKRRWSPAFGVLLPVPSRKVQLTEDIVPQTAHGLSVTSSEEKDANCAVGGEGTHEFGAPRSIIESADRDIHQPFVIRGHLQRGKELESEIDELLDLIPDSALAKLRIFSGDRCRKYSENSAAKGNSNCIAPKGSLGEEKTCHYFAEDYLPAENECSKVEVNAKKFLQATRELTGTQKIGESANLRQRHSIPASQTEDSQTEGSTDHGTNSSSHPDSLSRLYAKIVGPSGAGSDTTPTLVEDPASTTYDVDGQGGPPPIGHSSADRSDRKKAKELPPNMIPKFCRNGFLYMDYCHFETLFSDVLDESQSSDDCEEESLSDNNRGDGTTPAPVSEDQKTCSLRSDSAVAAERWGSASSVTAEPAQRKEPSDDSHVVHEKSSKLIDRLRSLQARLFGVKRRGLTAGASHTSYLQESSYPCLWAGTALASTRVHYDTYGVNLNLQLAGVKRWILGPPPNYFRKKGYDADVGLEATSSNQWPENFFQPTRIPFEESSVFASNVECSSLRGFLDVSESDADEAAFGETKPRSHKEGLRSYCESEQVLAKSGEQALASEKREEEGAHNVQVQASTNDNDNVMQSEDDDHRRDQRLSLRRKGSTGAYQTRFNPSEDLNHAHESSPSLKLYTVDLEPGDLLFVPHHWWHGCVCLTPSLSINQWLHHENDDRARLEEQIARLVVGGVCQRLSHRSNSFARPNGNWWTLEEPEDSEDSEGAELGEGNSACSSSGGDLEAGVSTIETPLSKDRSETRSERPPLDAHSLDVKLIALALKASNKSEQHASDTAMAQSEPATGGEAGFGENGSNRIPSASCRRVGEGKPIQTANTFSSLQNSLIEAVGDPEVISLIRQKLERRLSLGPRFK